MYAHSASSFASPSLKVCPPQMRCKANPQGEFLSTNVFDLLGVPCASYQGRHCQIKKLIGIEGTRDDLEARMDHQHHSLLRSRK